MLQIHVNLCGTVKLLEPVRLEPATPRSRIKHSTTEPLRSLRIVVSYNMIFKHLLYRRGVFELRIFNIMLVISQELEVLSLSHLYYVVMTL